MHNSTPRWIPTSKVRATMEAAQLTLVRRFKTLTWVPYAQVTDSESRASVVLASYISWSRSEDPAGEQADEALLLFRALAWRGAQLSAQVRGTE